MTPENSPAKYRLHEVLSAYPDIAVQRDRVGGMYVRVSGILNGAFNREIFLSLRQPDGNPISSVVITARNIPLGEWNAPLRTPQAIYELSPAQSEGRTILMEEASVENIDPIEVVSQSKKGLEIFDALLQAQIEHPEQHLVTSIATRAYDRMNGKNPYKDMEEGWPEIFIRMRRSGVIDLKDDLTNQWRYIKWVLQGQIGKQPAPVSTSVQ